MRVVAIIPAFNEEKYIGDVLTVLTEAELINTIVVVSDGSTDGTVNVCREYGVTAIKLEENKGKGAAMKAGLDSVEADIILFLDADLIGLTKEHVNSLLMPVIKGEAEMTIGIFDKGRFATDLAQKVAPYLSGQRAVKKTVLENISNMDISRFGVEIALTKMIEEKGVKTKEVLLRDMSHVMKEEKMGLIKGIAARIVMYWEIVKCFTRND
ncbi:MAG TPA: glycosyltransferase family 2 protein [Firmicutes bacterium]|nr:glycosyltransferase family 2 protein [Bacillota bacterium]